MVLFVVNGLIVNLFLLIIFSYRITKYNDSVALIFFTVRLEITDVQHAYLWYHSFKK